MAETKPDTAKDVTGGCLCGKVRYRVRTESDEAYYCHCRMCQLAFGNTRVAWFNVPQAALTWEGGEPTYYASSKFARRGFCSTCGTPLSFAYIDSKRMDVSIGSLDDPSVLHPVSHFAVESRIENWHADDGLPGDRLDTSEKLNARWRRATATPSYPAWMRSARPDPHTTAARGASRASRIGRWISAAPTASTMSAYHIQS